MLRDSLSFTVGAAVLLCAGTALASCTAGAPAWPSLTPSADDAGTSASANEGGATPTPDTGCGGAPTLAAIQTGIFSGSCAFGSCHGGMHPAAGLDLTSGNACGSLVSKSSCDFTTRVRVVPGNPDMSYLYQKVAGTDLGTNPDGPCAGQTNGTPARMPLGGTPLCDGQIAQIRQWILAGAACDEDAGGPDAAATQADSGAANDAAMESSSPAPDAASDAALPTVEQMTSAVSEIDAGKQANATVTLSAPAPASGLSVMLTATDTTVLAVPTAVFVAGGQTTGTFAVSGLRPGHASIQATAGASTASLAEVVVGLSIAEIFYNDTQYSDGEQWVRLYNSTSMTLDLSQYSLGAGSTSYTQTTAQLSGTIAPGACFVIGGPTSNVYNGGPSYSQILHLSPDLPMGGTTGAGVALFSVPAESITASTVPVDAIVYGDANTAGLMGPMGTPIRPSTEDAAPGTSLLLQNSVWVDNLAPSPSACN
jgi:hypothetical protein